MPSNESIMGGMTPKPYPESHSSPIQTKDQLPDWVKRRAISIAAKQPPGPNDKDSNGSSLLTMAETARALRVSTRTIARLVADGRLESFRVGRSVRIPLHGLPGRVMIK